jgi:hypothetical protein
VEEIEAEDVEEDGLDEMQVTKKAKSVQNGGLEETGSEIGGTALPFDQVRPL